MSTTKAAGKVPALILNLPGAPSEWHSVQGLPGFYHPEIPTVIGDQPGDVPEELARQFAKDKGAPVEITHLTDKEADDARDHQRGQMQAAARSLRHQRREASSEHVHAEATAMSGQEA